MRITSNLPDTLDSLIGAIIDTKGIKPLFDWLRLVNLGQFTSTLLAKDDEEYEKEWRYFIAKDLYAFSTCYGLEYMIAELFPSLNEILELAKQWFCPSDDSPNSIGQTQHEIFFYWCCEQAFEERPNFRTLQTIVHTLLEQRPAIQKYFEVHNYGLENIKAKIDRFYIEIPADNNLVEEAQLREKYTESWNISKDLEALLKLILLFYQAYFYQDSSVDKRFALANECFAEAIEQSKNGLQPTIQSMRSIDNFFENGESNTQRRNRVQTLEKDVEKLMAKRQSNKEIYFERKDMFWRKESEYRDQKDLVTAQLDLEKELKQDADRITNLKAQITELNGYIEIVKQQIQELENDYKTEETRLNTAIDSRRQKDQEETDQRSLVAEELRRKCIAAFQRTAPFGTLDTQRIDPIRKSYRNPISHTPKEIIDEWAQEKGIAPLKKFATYVRELLQHLDHENLCPMTYISLANMVDSYGRSVSILAQMDTPPERQESWPLEKTLWVYDLEQTIRFAVSDAYFIVPVGSNVSLLNPARRVLFEPARIACAPLVTKLKKMFPPIDVEL